MRGKRVRLQPVHQFLHVPVVAYLAWPAGAERPFGFDGWRWVVLIGSIGAVFVWFIRRRIPELPALACPPWPLRRGRPRHRRDRGESRRRSRAAARPGRTCRPRKPATARSPRSGSRPTRRRAIILSVFNFFQTFGYYGFAAWVPTLLIAKGINVTTSLQYAFIIAIANPAGPLLGMLVADRMERKWQICLAAVGIGVFGLAVRGATGPRPADPVRHRR